MVGSKFSSRAARPVTNEPDVPADNTLEEAKARPARERRFG